MHQLSAAVAEVKKAAEVKGGDLTCTALAVTPVGVSVSDSLRSAGNNNTLVKHRWRRAGGVHSVRQHGASSFSEDTLLLLVVLLLQKRDEPGNDAADPQTVFNSTARRKGRSSHVHEVLGLIFIYNCHHVFKFSFLLIVSEKQNVSLSAVHQQQRFIKLVDCKYEHYKLLPLTVI